MRILLVEDEQLLAETLADVLAQAGYLVDVSADGESGLDNARSGIYDAMVLDVMLPKLDGFTLLQRLREEHSRLPVLMLTARGDLKDRVRGLNGGADYYLTKPFENAEFLACLGAVLRRQSEIVPESLVFGDLLLIPSACELRKGELCLRLNQKETEILRLLISNSTQYLPRETLFLKVWGYASEVGDNNVESYISFLRKKLSILHSAVNIAVLRRVGYRLEVTAP
ncbi:response regulator transcription factor [uncultured Oscillibacter sp.]|uniref:response regulator transcription factor n=1 Tax=uncultured Oscillibacter sp. TaxID=876091 RepID=UPI0025DC1189|nr:response regulator transcription factor [uncultured Oscillibacter sp.]